MKEFIRGLILLTYNSQKAKELHHDLSGSEKSIAELIIGRFNAIEVTNLVLFVSISENSEFP